MIIPQNLSGVRRENRAEEKQPEAKFHYVKNHSRISRFYITASRVLKPIHLSHSKDKGTISSPLWKTVFLKLREEL